MADVNYSVKAAARRTGLSPHVIRVWEKRYGAVRPNRTDSNRRTYSEGEIDRLVLLRAATNAGHSIGQIAALEDDQLRELAGNLVTAEAAVAAVAAKTSATAFVEKAVEVVQQLNAAALEEVLVEAVKQFGTQGLLQKVVVPLTYRIGDLWHRGDVTAAEEHFATSHLRSFLGNLLRPFVTDPTAPLLVAGTPLGQHHEMGALIVGGAASSLGWRVANLASSLPAAEIASAASRGKARAVALSVVYPEDDPNLPAEFRTLRRLLPKPMELLVGGRAAPAYREVLDEIEARICSSSEQFCEEITSIREAR